MLLEQLESMITFFTMVIILLFLKKYLFLEYNTPEQKKKALRAMAICLLVSAVLSVVLYYVSNPRLMDFVGYGFLFFLFAPLLYSSFTGRKHAKWLALPSLVPMLGFYSTFYTVICLPVRSLSGEAREWYKPGVNLVLLLVMFFCHKRKTRFTRKLEQEIRYRSLSWGEELTVWIVGIMLALFKLSGIYEARATKGAYLAALNLLIAFLVVLYILDHNYRRFYYKKMLLLQKSLITTMADLVESRDENTGGHIQRTAKYVEMIAKKLYEQHKFEDLLTKKTIEDMVLAAPLHDVGKIHVPDEVLNKPGRLNEEEFRQMQSHAARGAEIIRRVEMQTGYISYLSVAEEMAGSHHERIDGKGYPMGITGEQIPLCAKILAVADVFDALVSKRCYKEPMPLDKAFSIIEEEAGTHFDETVAAAFLSMREEITAYLAEQ